MYFSLYCHHIHVNVHLSVFNVFVFSDTFAVPSDEDIARLYREIHVGVSTPLVTAQTCT